jgi:membrane-associated phospholipid phosphatase
MIRKAALRAKKPSGVIGLLSVELSLAFIAFFIFLTLLVNVVKQVFGKDQPAFDQKVFDYLLPYVTHRNNSIMEVFTFMGSHKFLIPAFLLLFAWHYFIHKNKRYFIRVVLITLNNLLLLFSLKVFFNRTRPLIPLFKEAAGFSFPSGHAFMGLTFFGLIIYMVYQEVSNKWIKWITIIILVLIIFMVGLSRVYLRVHYATDVIAGYCFGILSFIILPVVLKQVEQLNAKKYFII